MNCLACGHPIERHTESSGCWKTERVDGQDVVCSCFCDPAVIAQAHLNKVVGILREVNEWIVNWEPEFTNDDEWEELDRRVHTTLTEYDK